MLRLIVTVLVSMACSVTWLIAAFLLQPSVLWPAELAFGPGEYLRTNVLPYEAAAWLYGRDSQGAHHGLLAWLSIGIWTLAFIPFVWLVFRRFGRRPLQTSGSAPLQP